jgi:hypothetical protein
MKGLLLGLTASAACAGAAQINFGESHVSKYAVVSTSPPPTPSRLSIPANGYKTLTFGNTIVDSAYAPLGQPWATYNYYIYGAPANQGFKVRLGHVVRKCERVCPVGGGQTRRLLRSSRKGLG